MNFIYRRPFFQRLACAFVLQILFSPVTNAQFRNANRPVCGNRAVGFSGAFTAISDDASGICYNPAGLAFSHLRKSTESSTAYVRSKEVSKNALGGRDLSTESSALKGFFGGMTKDFSIFENVPIAFAVVVPEAGERHQSLDFESIELGSEEGSYKVTESFLKRVFVLGAAYNIDSDLAIGGSASFAHTTLRQTSSSFAVLADKGAVVADDPTKKYRVSQGRQITADSVELWLKIGAVRRLTSKTNIGIFVSHAQTPWRKVSIENDFSFYEISGSPDPKGSVPSQQNGSRRTTSNDLPKIYYGPWTARLGLLHSFRASTKASLDIQYVLPQKVEDDPLNGLHPTWDVAVGMESVLSQAFLLRSGLFTSFDQRNGPKDADNAMPADSRVDEYGLSLSGGVVDDTSEYSLTSTWIYGKGRGASVNIGNVSPVRDVSRLSLEIALGLSTKI